MIATICRHDYNWVNVLVVNYKPIDYIEHDPSLTNWGILWC